MFDISHAFLPLTVTSCKHSSKSWNDLPLHLCAITNTDAFKRRLKTHFFCKFYDLEYDCM